MEDLRLGVKSYLQPLGFPTTTATATWDLSHVYNLHRSSRQHWILNTQGGVRDKPASSWILVGFVTT